MGRVTRFGFVIAGIVATCALMTPEAAVAGGSCHGAATEGSGGTVAIEEVCFTPSLLHVRPGDTVTFRNDDPFEHNVVGNGWGIPDGLAPGDRFRQTFADAGVYPFACTLHPGMVGAVLVGDATTTHEVIAPITPPAPTPPADGADAIGWIVPAVIGIAVGGAAVTLRGRRRGTITVPA
jgi:plastocyanin